MRVLKSTTFFLILVTILSYDCELHPSYQERIDKDLENFREGIPPSMLQKLKKLKRAIYFTVKDNKMTASRYQNPRNSGKLWQNWKNYFVGLAPHLPNMQFLVNLYDEPRVLKRQCSPEEDWRKCACDKDYKIPEHSFFIRPCESPILYEKMPVFSAGILPECFADILIPSGFHIIERPMKEVPWNSKTFKVFWRGGSTGMNLDSGNECDVVEWAKDPVDLYRYHRIKLINLCRKIKDCQAGISLVKQCSRQKCQMLKREYGGSFVKMDVQAQFKVLIDIDGNTYSQRFPNLLRSGSAVMKIASFLDIGFIPAKEWVHYIPVKMDFSDFEDNIEWAREHDDELQKIGQNGKQLVKTTFTQQQYKCYAIKVLTQYSTLLVTEEQYEANKAEKGPSKYQYNHKNSQSSSSNSKKEEKISKQDDISDNCTIQSSFETRIDKDLAHFSDGIPSKMIEKAKSQPNVHIFTVKNQKMQSKGLAIEQNWKNFFYSLAKHLPDMEFVVNTNNEPRVIKNGCKPESEWKNCSCDKDYQIPPHGFFMRPFKWMPIYDNIPLFSAVTLPECFGDILVPSKQSLKTHHFQNKITWKDRQFKAIWRGSTQGSNFKQLYDQSVSFEQKQYPFDKFHRQRLVEMCSEMNDCDAKFSSYKQCDANICSQMRYSYGRQSCISMESQSINKIIVDIDGNSFSGKFSEALATGSAVLKISAFLDISLVPARPMYHYLPVKMDLSDLKEKIEWARSNDRELQKMSLRGAELRWNTLTIKNYKCYMIKLLKKYHSLLISDEQYDKKIKNKNQ